ncbi:hypothetical protein KO361_02315 [Candidatus Woesearchaeota archaeon]|nr:hypothetical protein [Candidatus Woesearchaeota archaeon]
MELREPEDMNELVYFTRRKTPEGSVRAWAFRELCPKCKKELMTKPIDSKTKRPKIRAKEYVCGSCNHEVPADEYESSLELCVDYVCGSCNHEGKTKIPFKRKSFLGVKSFVFECDSCKVKIPITKKMKEPKKKKTKTIDVEDL